MYYCIILGTGNSLPLLAHQVPIVVKQAERKLAETLARKFPSIFYVAFLSFIAGSLNGLTGNSVVEVTGSMKYVRHYTPKEGYYTYLWDIEWL